MTGNGVSANKTALVLSGGGAFGAYEVGVIRALYSGKSPSTSSKPLDADVFVGTSVGSFNAAVLAMNKGGAQASAKRLHDIWINDIADNGDGRGNRVYRIRGDITHYLDPRTADSPIDPLRRLVDDAGAVGSVALRRAAMLLSGTGTLLSRVGGLIDMSVLLNTEPFQKLVKDYIDPAALRESPKHLSVTATNWSSGEAQGFGFRVMPDQHVWDAIRASAAIPALFPAIRMNDQYFIDGGCVMNTPISPAIDKDATEIHVISLDPEISDLPKDYTGTTMDILSRVYTAMMAAMIREDIKSAEWVNEGIEVLERVAAGEEFDSDDGRKFTRVARVIEDRLEKEGELPVKLTVHHYYPKRPLGGMLGMLNFHRPSIDAMIKAGYEDACAHDCKANGCVIPKAAAMARPAAAES